MKKIESLVEHHQTKGGSHPKSPWGPQYSPDDDNMLNRDKHAEHHYFRDIIAGIDPQSDHLVVFGPAEAKVGLKKEILALKHYHPKLDAVLPSDYITEREMAALVRDFFNNPGAYIKPEEVEG